MRVTQRVEVNLRGTQPVKAKYIKARLRGTQPDKIGSSDSQVVTGKIERYSIR